MTDTLVPTPEQAAIISYPLAPLRVAAGAGTGKTATIAWRVAHLVAEHGVRPDQVLGITFTNKAAHELASRVREVLAEDLPPGESVDVFTYHGFAADILADHGLRIGVERGSRVITPTFARQLLLDSVTHSEFTHTDITSRRKIISDLDRLASDLGDNLLTPDELLRRRRGGDTGTASEDDIAIRRGEYARVLQRFDQLKRRLNALDYADLIRLAHVLVTDDPNVAAEIRARYRVVLLDEYQDTNPAQRLLLQAVFGAGFPVTAVGDQHQTIYEWRGASLQNFADFPHHFPDGRGRPAATLGLTLNRRSGAAILELANRVRAEVSGETADPLRPLETAPEATVEADWFRTSRDEAEAIAGEIRRLHDDAGMSWREMAVLFRKNKDIALIREVLEDHGIPLQVANLGGLLTIPEVVEVHAWLRVLADSEDTPALARILMGSKYRIGMADMRKLADWVREQPDDLADEDEHLPAHTLAEALEHLDEIDLDAVTGEALEDFLARYRRLLVAAQGTSLVELVQRILAETDAWRDVRAMPASAQLSARLNLYRFLDLAESWSPLEGRPSLPAFIAYLDLMESEDIEELDTARISDDDAVTLVTVHRAKGLEWEAVFLPALHRNNFPSGVRMYEDPFAQAAILPFDMRLDRDDLPHVTGEMPKKERQEMLKRRHLDQEWRLAYVAVTRARSYLYLSGSAWTGTPVPRKTPAEPGPLLELAAEHAGHRTWIDEPGERPEVLGLEDLAHSPDPLFSDGWDTALRTAIEQPTTLEARATEIGVEAAYHARVSEYQEMLFSLPEPAAREADEPGPLETSVTGLVTYATCPRRFFWSEVDRLPRRASRAARRGVELHRRIELYNRGAVPFDDLDPDAYDVAPAEFEGSEEAGSAFQRFKASRFARAQPRFVEAPFDLRLDDHARIRGRIDAIYEHEPDHWEVVDFKSGRPSVSPAATVQLEAYAVAAREAGFAPTPPERLDVTFAYFGGGFTEHTTTVDAQWLSAAQTHLNDIVDAIRQEHFDPAASAACASCDFLRFCPAGQAWMEESSQEEPGR